jgi:hypothetical protein
MLSFSEITVSETIVLYRAGALAAWEKILT